MLVLSSAAIAEKNKISSTGAWLQLLEITFLGQSTIRLVYNNEDITWDGNTYQGYPILVGALSEDGKGGLPTFAIRVSNVGRSLEPYIDASNGGIGASLRLLVVHSDLLAAATAEIDETFENMACSVDPLWVTFKLGSENPMRKRSPKDRYLKDHCRYKEFKGTMCGYAGPESTCNRTFIRCKQLNHAARFGGFPGVGGGVYV